MIGGTSIDLLVSLPGDFNGNGVLDIEDIDDLTTQTAGGTNPAGYDLNGDALVNVDDIAVWIKDRANSWVGDANLDGEFNSSDLVTVLASGTYEADVASVWSTGDFNGDGRTNSTDLVAALADGGYEAGPRAAVASVPEPASGWLATIALVLVAAVRRRRS
jgi:MYXO-CTERM domain-containing protein